LKAHGIIPSMSGKGNCYDNATVETVKTIKNELENDLPDSRSRRIGSWPINRRLLQSTFWDTNRRHHSTPKLPSWSKSLSTKSGQVHALEKLA
jgi:transposase InsO family protein